MTAPAFTQLHPDDSVAVALRNLPVGYEVQVGAEAFALQSPVPAGHKLAVRHISQGESVMKFGFPIGEATCSIAMGSHVHSHNLACISYGNSLPNESNLPQPPPPRQLEFDGFVRANGKVGTRNYLAVISNVNCSASVARLIAQQFSDDNLQEFPNIDGVISLRHESGCAMAWRGSRHEMLSRTLGGFAKHPNIGGFILVGLGCEQGTLDYLQESQQLYNLALPGQLPIPGQTDRVPVLSIQSSGGTAESVKLGAEKVRELLPQVNQWKRSKVSAEHLILGLECGGSDGYSGITANPLLGMVSDRLVAAGGTVVLSETSEIVGAEQLLTKRARTPQVAKALLDRIQWWKNYCGNYGEEFDNNPSVGNKQGGLTTITEKSLGAVSKAGSTTLEAVYEYAEPIERRGFVFMDTPGFDPTSVTGMVAGGANLIAFTTGRGSCFGFKPTPSYKISSNSTTFERLPDDMDFNAGRCLEGENTEQLAEELLQNLLATASGKETCSERLGIGDEEFIPWQVGPIL